MKSSRHSLLTFTSLLLALSLCVGLMAGPVVGAASPKRDKVDAKLQGVDKVSSDLRERIAARKGDKRGSDLVSVIIQIEGKPTGGLNALLNRNGVHIKGNFDNLNMLVVELPADVIDELASYVEVSYVSADREVTSLGSLISTTTGADAVRQQTTATGTAYTLDGTGIGIAFLDSGIYSTHKSFTGRVGASKDYTGENRTDDPFGHGSHVAAIAAGNGSVSSGKYIGIAPNATIYDVRVLNSLGVGKVSSVLAGLNDLLTYHTTYNIRVVNMSLGMPAIDSYKNDPICRAVRQLVNAGVVVVVAAGNDGKNIDGQKVYGERKSQ